MKSVYIYGIVLAIMLLLPVTPARGADRGSGEIKDAIDKISTAAQGPPATGTNNCDGISLLNVCSGSVSAPAARPQSGPVPPPAVNAPQGPTGKANAHRSGEMRHVVYCYGLCRSRARLMQRLRRLGAPEAVSRSRFLVSYSITLKVIN